MKHNNLKFWCYPELSILSVLLVLSTTVCIIWINEIVGIEGATKSENDALFIRILMSSLALGLIILVLCKSKAAFSNVVFSEDNIAFKSLFHKTITYNYEQYRYIYRGQYFHGNIFGQGILVEFIIFSQNSISTNDLYSANRIANSAETIKIRFSFKRYEKLCAIVPVSMRVKLDKMFNSKTR